MGAQGALEHRRALLAGLAGLAGRVLEVGAGNGLTFAHYPTAVTELLAVEPESYLRALAELRREPRPGGELRFVEHIQADTSGLARAQLRAGIIWPTLVGGCHTSRDTLTASRPEARHRTD